MAKKSKLRAKTSSILPSLIPPTLNSTSITIPKNNKINKIKKSKKSKGKEREIHYDSTPPPPTVKIVKKLVKKGKKKNLKKRVRIGTDSEVEEEEEDEEVEEESSRSRSASVEGSDIESSLNGRGGKKGEAEDTTFDWWDPRILPKTGNGKGRTQNQLKGLEFNTYKTALHDTVSNSLDLGRTLISWEAVKRKRIEEEELELQKALNQSSEGSARRVEEEQEEIYDGIHTSNTNAEASTSQIKIDSNSNSPELNRQINNSYPSTSSRSSLESIATSLPFLSSLTLSKITRWPIPLSQLNTSSSTTNSLQDLIATLTNKSIEKNPRSRKRLKPKIKSAYDSDGPLAEIKATTQRLDVKKNGNGKEDRRQNLFSEVSSVGEDNLISRSLLNQDYQQQHSSSSQNIAGMDDLMLDDKDDNQDDDEEAEESLDQADDDDDDSDTSSLFSSSSSLVTTISDEDITNTSTFTGKTSLKTTHLLDQVLSKLSEKVPKSSWPPRDYWEAKIRLENGDDVTTREKALDWEDVIGVLKDLGNVPKSISDSLTSKMEAIYGPAKRVPPPPLHPTPSRSTSVRRSATPKESPSRKRSLSSESDFEQQRPAKKSKGLSPIKRSKSRSTTSRSNSNKSLGLDSATSTPPPAFNNTSHNHNHNQFSSPSNLYSHAEEPSSPTSLPRLGPPSSSPLPHFNNLNSRNDVNWLLPFEKRREHSISSATTETADYLDPALM